MGSAVRSYETCKKRTQAAVTNRQNNGRHGDEENVGKACNDQEELGRLTAVVVEVVDRYYAGSPGGDEEHNEGQNNLGGGGGVTRREVTPCSFLTQLLRDGSFINGLFFFFIFIALHLSHHLPQLMPCHQVWV